MTSAKHFHLFDGSMSLVDIVMVVVVVVVKLLECLGHKIFVYLVVLF